MKLFLLNVVGQNNVEVTCFFSHTMFVNGTKDSLYRFPWKFRLILFSACLGKWFHKAFPNKFADIMFIANHIPFALVKIEENVMWIIEPNIPRCLVRRLGQVDDAAVLVPPSKKIIIYVLLRTADIKHNLFCRSSSRSFTEMMSPAVKISSTSSPIFSVVFNLSVSSLYWVAPYF